MIVLVKTPVLYHPNLCYTREKFVHKGGSMKQSGNIIVILSLLVAVGASFAAGYFYLQSHTVNPKVDSGMTPKVSAMPSPTTETVKTTPKSGHTAVVVYEGALSSNPDKAAIQAKIVNPLLDYFADENGEGYIVSVTIGENAYESKTTYPYSASVVFNNGGNMGFVIEKPNGEIKWWAPECMVCTFSASFKAKYPEIVKLFDN